MFGRLFQRKQSQPKARFLVVQLNARLQPMHRGEIFEDPLDAVLKKDKQGEVSGGGTVQATNGEIESCDIELQVPSSSPETIALIIKTLEQLGAPKGSRLTVADTGHEILFGTTEGLAVYLNGTDLPDETYQNCDANHVLSSFDSLLEGEGHVFSYWQGPTETALYLYGNSFEQMKQRLSEFVETYPLCKGCRMVQIA